ncbi:MAG: WD40 repeat domain-containing protein [Bacteroidota bacterium]
MPLKANAKLNGGITMAATATKFGAQMIDGYTYISRLRIFSLTLKKLSSYLYFHLTLLMNRILFLILIFVGLITGCQKIPSDCVQCNDPAAKNYNSNATSDTTCCIYGKIKPAVKTKLDDEVQETSGLVFANGRLWTHNDSGGKPALYAVDSSNGKILQTVVLDGATNVDWEDMTRSSTHLYVGDMGNNTGNRKNLRIYRFPLQLLDSTKDTIHVISETISFSYADQTDFTPREEHNFDCEALIYSQDHLYLFTKNRQDNRCNIYMLPAVTGTYQAEKQTSFHSRGLVTGASISATGKEIVLVGYTKSLSVFAWILSGYTGNQFLSADRKLFRLGDFSGAGQMEAVSYIDNNTLFFSSEKVLTVPARLYRLPTNLFRE